jgi:hypothetical protein
MRNETVIQMLEALKSVRRYFRANLASTPPDLIARIDAAIQRADAEQRGRLTTDLLKSSWARSSEIFALRCCASSWSTAALLESDLRLKRRLFQLVEQVPPGLSIPGSRPLAAPRNDQRIGCDWFHGISEASPRVCREVRLGIAKVAINPYDSAEK